MIFILNDVFNFQCCIHQSSCYNICCLVIFANSSLGYSVTLGPVQRLFCPGRAFQGLSHKTCKTVSSSGSILKWLRLLVFILALRYYYFSQACPSLPLCQGVGLQGPAEITPPLRAFPEHTSQHSLPSSLNC